MSAFANTSKHTANIASVQLNSEPTVTPISVNARIDYIQRYSQQAVLVIDDDVNVYTQAARQFLLGLTKENSHDESNVAFVSASKKLNDIQIRCRLIEQLFANTLFDPEKSLAVSILQLSKQSKEAVMIVVEHAHALSLQLKYELCQLVDVANKTDNNINVVLFSQTQAAQEVASNKTIFNNKLAIIDAQSGQIFALDNPKFKHKNNLLTPKFWRNTALTTLTIATVIGLSWYMLINTDSFTLAKLPLVENNIKTIAISEKETPQATTQVVEQSMPADSKDIFAALSSTAELTSTSFEAPANTSDIVAALALDDEALNQPVKAEPAVETQAVIKVEQQQSSPVATINEKAEVAIQDETGKSLSHVKANSSEDKSLNFSKPTDLPVTLAPSYYLNASTGYVIQIVGFSDMSLLARFIEQYPTLTYFSYQKVVNGKLLVVLTTPVYADKAQARAALALLPETIKARGVWIKPLSTVKTEIAAL